jgi:hypothetical protein
MPEHSNPVIRSFDLFHQCGFFIEKQICKRVDLRNLLFIFIFISGFTAPGAIILNPATFFFFRSLYGYSNDSRMTIKNNYFHYLPVGILFTFVR